VKDVKDVAADDKTAKTKTVTCPICGGKAELYEGNNEHKQDTCFCPKDGRVALKG
jgi:transposase